MAIEIHYIINNEQNLTTKTTVSLSSAQALCVPESGRVQMISLFFPFLFQADDILSTIEASTISFFLRTIRHRLDFIFYGLDIQMLNMIDNEETGLFMTLIDFRSRVTRVPI